MTWRFRKSFSPLPGARLTLSPAGFSAYLDTVSPPSSAGTEQLTALGLAEFKTFLQQAHRESDETARELKRSREEETACLEAYTRWRKGRILRRLFKKKFAQLQTRAEEAAACRGELEEQEPLSRLSIQIDIPPGVAGAFQCLVDAFATLTRSQRIWVTVGKRSADQAAERTSAAWIVDRKPVRFRLVAGDLIQFGSNVPHLENSNSGDIYFYPFFLVCFETHERFALMAYNEIQLRFTTTFFQETETLPSDSQIVGMTWAKANKDGSRDQRYNDNYQIPIVHYGELALTSRSGMNKEYMISNVPATEAFARAWQAFADAVAAGV